MRIEDKLQEVLDLQPEWTARRTPAMERRGLIIRTELPAVLAEYERVLRAAMSPFGDEFSVQGKDQQGNYSEIPWTRICSSVRSPNARTGWYLAYLFGATGERCYLALGHASTRFTSREFQSLPPRELATLAMWARRQLNERSSIRSDLRQVIDLAARRTNLGEAYANGVAYAVEYVSGNIPETAELLRDLKYMLGLLSVLYDVEETEGADSVELPDELLDALEDADAAAGRPRRKSRAQGRRQSAAERKAVENRAIEMANDYLMSRDYQVNYVGNSESFDIEATRGEEILHVEVKGTTSAGTQVILTANEVTHHQRVHPRNALIVVHSIVSVGKDENAAASGGVLRCISPWAIEESGLSPISFRYLV